MSVKQVQNFYKDTVKTAWTSGAGNFYVSTAKPTVAPGFLVVSPGDASKREIIYYTATGTDGGGDYITVSSAAHRGLGGTTAQAHAVSEKIRMNLTAQNWQEVIDELATKYGPGITVPTPTLPGDTVNKDYADNLAIAGSPNASTSVKGISKLTATPMKSLGTATITIATPGVITLASHGLIAGDTIELTTSGALPTGLSASTTYFVISTGLTANEFQVSLSNAGAAINTTGSQSGIHTLFRTTPYAVSDLDPSFVQFFTENGAANAYSLVATTVTSYVNGARYFFRATNANTTTSTLTINGIGAKTIYKGGGATALESGDIAAGMNVAVIYDSVTDSFRMLNPGAVIQPTSVLATQFLAAENIAAKDAVVIDSAITFGGATSGQIASGTTLTFNVTTAGIYRGLFAWITEATASTISSVTYNGVAMTLVTSQTNGGSKMYLYSLVNPTTGTNSLVVTRSGSSNSMLCSTAYYNGVDQSTIVDASNSGVDVTTATPTATITIGVADSMMAMCVYNAGGNPYTASTNATDRNCGISYHEVFDSNEQFAAGATSMLATSGVNTHVWIIVSFKNDTSKKIKKASGSTARLSDAFVGFARNAITLASTDYVDTQGEISGFTGLVIGAKYYLSNTSGLVSTTAGTVTRKVGIATSPTTMLITNIW